MVSAVSIFIGTMVTRIGCHPLTLASIVSNQPPIQARSHMSDMPMSNNAWQNLIFQNMKATTCSVLSFTKLSPRAASTSDLPRRYKHIDAMRPSCILIRSIVQLERRKGRAHHGALVLDVSIGGQDDLFHNHWPLY